MLWVKKTKKEQKATKYPLHAALCPLYTQAVYIPHPAEKKSGFMLKTDHKQREKKRLETSTQ